MSSFEVLVLPIDQVIDHPNADRLSICKIRGYDAVTNKHPDGSHRFQTGELIVYVPESAVIPEHLLRQYGYWSEEKNMGLLTGSKGDRVKAIRLRNVLSQGLVWKLHDGEVDNAGVRLPVTLGDDVTEFLQITKHIPKIPDVLSGRVIPSSEHAVDFDIENTQKFPDILVNDEVEVTEKIHGTCVIVSFRPDVTNPELFNECVSITSKGQGRKGIVFSNVVGNVYTRTILRLDLVNRVEQLGRELNASVDILGEIFGKGVQDLHYGRNEPDFRAFDIRINGQYLPSDEKTAMMERLGIQRVPVLYRGKWDIGILHGLRDGKTTLGGDHIREGIIVTALGDQSRRDWSIRPCVKMVSPDYLTRKGNATEYE